MCGGRVWGLGSNMCVARLHLYTRFRSLLGLAHVSRFDSVNVQVWNAANEIRAPVNIGDAVGWRWLVRWCCDGGGGGCGVRRYRCVSVYVDPEKMRMVVCMCQTDDDDDDDSDDDVARTGFGSCWKSALCACVRDPYHLQTAANAAAAAP